MNPEKRRLLEAAGWTVGTAAKFLGRFPPTSVTEEDNGPPDDPDEEFEEDDDDLEAGWPQGRTLQDAIMANMVGNAYRWLMHSRGQEARTL